MTHTTDAIKSLHSQARKILLASVVCAVVAGYGVAAAEQSLGEQLLISVQQGDLAEVRRLVEEGAYKPTTMSGIMALGLAKSEGHAEIEEVLQSKSDEYVESGALVCCP